MIKRIIGRVVSILPVIVILALSDVSLWGYEYHLFIQNQMSTRLEKLKPRLD